MQTMLLVQRETMGFRKMSRLIAFGDSFTFGHYLPDCDEQPSMLAWPQLLGDKLGLEVVNQSSPGASNNEILFTILNFKFQPTDLVVVGWTFVHRDLLYKKSFFGKLFNKDEHRRVSIHDNDDISKKWQEVHTDYDRRIRTGLLIEHADLYLRSLNLRHYHFFALDFFNLKPIWTHKPVTWINETIIKYKDFALDNKHPGIKTHSLAADTLYRIINET